MPILLIGLLFLFLPLYAHAEGPVFEYGYNCTISWENPTDRPDGSRLEPSEISASNLYISSSQAALGTSLAATTTDTTMRCEDTGMAFPAGQYYVAVTAVDTEGFESDLSTAFPFMFSVPPPSAPSSLLVE